MDARKKIENRRRYCSRHVVMAATRHPGRHDVISSTCAAAAAVRPRVLTNSTAAMADTTSRSFSALQLSRP